jgi:hypothetical protein
VAAAGSPDLTTGPEAVLRQHLEQHVHGVGPAAAKVLGLSDNCSLSTTCQLQCGITAAAPSPNVQSM